MMLLPLFDGLALGPATVFPLGGDDGGDGGGGGGCGDGGGNGGGGGGDGGGVLGSSISDSSMRTRKTGHAYGHRLAFYVHARHSHTELVDVHGLCCFDLHVTKTSIRDVCYGFGQEQELVHGVRKTHLHVLKPQVCGGTSCAEAEPRHVARHSLTSARQSVHCRRTARTAQR